MLGRRYLVRRNLYAQLAFALAIVGLRLSICYMKNEPDCSGTLKDRQSNIRSMAKSV